jgi:uncharacterized protein
VKDEEGLLLELRSLATLLSDHLGYIFVDEITAVPNWVRSVKRLVDAGELRNVLLVTTGSRAKDLRRGSERLPGRKGKLVRTDYLFLPVSYREFKRVCGERLGADTLTAYILSGGVPAACSELAQHGRIPEYIITMMQDWIHGDIAATGRSRSSLLAIMDVLHRFGTKPVGQAKLAREAGLANNTVAAGYLELLADLLCLGFELPWDQNRNIRLRRKPAKYPFINLLAALVWSPSRVRSITEFNALPNDEKGIWWEWLTAQELWRRAALRGDLTPEHLTFWQSDKHEVDFIAAPDHFIETKLGKASPTEFVWFPRVFPKARLQVINQVPFQAGPVQGLTMEDFLEE